MTHGMPTAPGETRAAGSARRGWWMLAIIVMVAGGSAVAWWQRAPDTPNGAAGPVRAALDDTSARAPGGSRVVVRVVNASGVRGLGRRATLVLRDYGYDVVDFDGAGGTPRTTTEILDHTGHPVWARHLQRALGTGSVSARADSSRYVDLTVLVGRDWQPPTQPLRP